MQRKASEMHHPNQAWFKVWTASGVFSARTRSTDLYAHTNRRNMYPYQLVHIYTMAQVRARHRPSSPLLIDSVFVLSFVLFIFLFDTALFMLSGVVED